MTDTDHRVRRALDGERSGLHNRVFALDDIHIRAGGDGRTVVAYAAVFDSPAEISDQDGHYSEQISRTAFDKSIGERSRKVGVFYNHARTLHGTPSERGSVPLGTPLEIKPDGRGLLTVSRYNKTPLADDVLESIRNGDITGQSFTGAFLQSDPPPPYYGRSGADLPLVTRKEIALVEYGPTPIPAYSDAEILGVRAAQQREAERGETRERESVTLTSRAEDGAEGKPGAAEADAAPDGQESPESGAEDAQEGERAASTARHEPVTGTHSHAHPAYGSQGGDSTHSHEHAHDGDASHSHSHAATGDDAMTGSGRMASAATGDLGGGWVQDQDGGIRYDPDGDGDDDSTPEGDTDHDYWAADGTQLQPVPARPPGRNAAISALIRDGFTLESATSAVADSNWSLLSRDAGRAASADNSAWDASKAWANGAASDDPAAFYAGICAGKKDGDKSTQAAWALPYKYTPSSPPNAAGVKNALSRLPQAQGLTNAAAAKTLLQGLMKKINPDYEPSGSGGTSGRSEDTPAASGAGAARSIPEPTPVPAAGPQPHPAGETTDGTGPQPHPDGHQNQEGKHVDTTMTVAQRAARQEEIRTRMAELDGQHPGTALPEDLQSEWDALDTEHGEHARAIEEHSRAIEARRSRLAVLAEAQAGESVEGEDSGYEPPASARSGESGGTRQRSAPATSRTDDSIWDTDAVRTRARSPEDAAAAYRDNAMRAIERANFPGSESRERAQSTVERLLHRVDDQNATLAKRILVTGSPLYMRAWSKAVARLSVNVLDAEESRALALGVGADGGFAVPFELDPTVILTSAGAINPLRDISRVQQIVGKEYDLVTSAGVTVSRSAEASAVSDNAPTLAQPTIKAERVTGFVPFSVEIEQDWAALQSEMMMLLADAKDIEESSSFTNGDGTGTNAGGIITTLASGSHVTGTGTSGTLAAGDLYATEDAMPPRFRAQAVWMASKTTYNAYRQLFTQTASAAGDEWVRPTQGTPAELLGYQAYEDSDMVATHATGDKVIILGDFKRGFIIVDRLGMSTELVPHLFDQATARPTGQRGLLCIWRNNCRVLVDAAFRQVVVP